MEENLFCERLKESMRLRGESVQTLSGKLEISVRALRSLLKGERLPKGRLLVKIATTLSVRVDYLLGLSDKQSK